MDELVVVSGKGGTGKTTVVASFAALAKDSVLADCDVDAADLHLVLSPEIVRKQDFIGGNEAVIRQADCIRCGACLAHCRFGAVRKGPGPAGEARFSIDALSCEGCGVCMELCPVRAIDFPERNCGQWFVSRTRFGTMVHARLDIAAENSGKLVTVVRQEARAVAAAAGKELIISDGPPGIGCPVIASITGASMVLVVTEPTLSAKHDLERLLDLAAHFSIPASICVNKSDINPAITDSICRLAGDRGIAVAGTIPYDASVTQAQIAGCSVVEYGETPAAQAITSIWNALQEKIRQTSSQACRQNEGIGKNATP